MVQQQISLKDVGNTNQHFNYQYTSYPAFVFKKDYTKNKSSL